MSPSTQIKSAPIVVLISGAGSNLQAIIEAINNGSINASIAAVISNNENAFGLVRAKNAGLTTHYMEAALHSGREQFDHALITLIDQYNPALIVLAGYLRILSDEFVNHYATKLINIHPSLLPQFPGLGTHRRALENNNSKHGATVHFVSADLDAGPLVAQVCVDILADDDEISLAQRVLTQEHRLYPLVIKWFIDQRLTLSENSVLLDGIQVRFPLQLAADNDQIEINGKLEYINH